MCVCVFVYMFDWISYIFQPISTKFDTVTANGPAEVLTAPKIDLSQYLNQHYRFFIFDQTHTCIIMCVHCTEADMDTFHVRINSGSIIRKKLDLSAYMGIRKDKNGHILILNAKVITMKDFCCSQTLRSKSQSD